MQRSDLSYTLPPELIAQQAVEPRDASRLLVLDRGTGRIEHRVFRDIAEYLQPGDCLVVNDTRVVQARFFCRRATGGVVEALFLRGGDDGAWHVLLKPSARLKQGERLACENSDVALDLLERHARGEWAVRPSRAIEPVAWLETVGRTPLPPYINRDSGPDAADRARYQTVYARRAGAIAAPTAGLHFTEELLRRLDELGVQRVSVTLHVGVGTFQPVVVDDLADHDMHSEWFEIAGDTLARLHAARASGRRIVAVGTTSARVLESLPLTIGDESASEERRAGWTDIFIYPPYEFTNVDVLLTNFHLPESTLLALVMAFATSEQVRAAYRAAIAKRYRFYSFGDAMLVL